jgi:hypothetical protein
LSGAALAAVLTENAASADVPTSVVSSTISAAKMFAAGHGAVAGAISPTVAALIEGVLKNMLLSKLKLGVAVLALVGVLGVGVVGVRSMQAADPQPVAKGDPRPVGIEPNEKENPGQPPDDAGAKGVRETLLRLEKAGWEALKEKERAAATANIADDFVAIMADGERQNRADFLKLLTDMILTDYSLSGVAFTQLTPDAAVLTYKMKTDYTYKGQAMKETVWVSSAWARRDGKWMNVLYHETRLTK